MTHADNNNILNSLQHGFRRGLSCETRLIEFIDDITCNMDAKTKTTPQPNPKKHPKKPKQTKTTTTTDRQTVMDFSIK